MISIPPASQAFVEQGRFLARPWSQFLRRLVEMIGLAPSVRVYRDLCFPGPALDVSMSAVVSSAILGNIYLPEYPAAADEGTAMLLRLPNDYREGTPLQPWVEWAPADANAGDVDWRVEYLLMRNGTALAAATTSLDETSDTPEVAGKPVRVEFDEIDSDFRKGDSFAVRLWRLGTADTYASSAYLIAAGMKYAADGIGTVEIHP